MKWCSVFWLSNAQLIHKWPNLICIKIRHNEHKFYTHLPKFDWKNHHENHHLTLLVFMYPVTDEHLATCRVAKIITFGNVFKEIIIVSRNTCTCPKPCGVGKVTGCVAAGHLVFPDQLASHQWMYIGCSVKLALKMYGWIKGGLHLHIAFSTKELACGI